jgi:ADP-ribose pyrophosphatase
VSEPLESRRGFEGRFVQVDVERWPHAEAYEVVRHPGAAGVLPITPDDQVLLVRQFRPPIRDALAEIPAGLLDVSGEDAVSCAARELREETGFRHQSIEFLGGYYASPGLSDEYVHVFWARTEDEPAGAPEDGIEILRKPIEEMIRAAGSGRVRDPKTALALLWYAAQRMLPDDRAR